MASKKKAAKRKPTRTLTFSLTMTDAQAREFESWMGERLAEFEGEEEELEEHRPGLLDILNTVYGALQSELPDG